LPRYRFRFEAAQLATADNCSFSRITVFNRQSGAVVQRIVVDPENASSLNCQLPVSMLLQSTDPNNDAFQDAFVLSFSAATNQIYDLWLFQPGSRRFRRGLTSLSNPSVNQSRREVTSTHQNGLGSSEQSLYRYKASRFYLYETKSRDFDEQIRAFRVVVKRLVNGRMQVVRRYTEQPQ